MIEQKLQPAILERRLRLPDPTKALEGVWKLLKRTRQQFDTTQGIATGVSIASVETHEMKKQAAIRAERQKAQGIAYTFRTSLR